MERISIFYHVCLAVGMKKGQIENGYIFSLFDWEEDWEEEMLFISIYCFALIT